MQHPFCTSEIQLYRASKIYILFDKTLNLNRSIVRFWKDFMFAGAGFEMIGNRKVFYITTVGELFYYPTCYEINTIKTIVQFFQSLHVTV